MRIISLQAPGSRGVPGVQRLRSITHRHRQCRLPRRPMHFIGRRGIDIIGVHREDPVIIHRVQQ